MFPMHISEHSEFCLRIVFISVFKKITDTIRELNATAGRVKLMYLSIATHGP